ncbi:MAG TPA: hypothetical protein VGI19_07155 [Candidatus Cybelea sp.]|jgi:hypothetical protein
MRFSKGLSKTKIDGKPRPESRLVPTLVVLALVLILVVVPRHYRLLPPFSEVVIGGALVAFLWTRFAPYAITAFAVIVGTIVVTILGRLLYEMATEPSHLDAVVLLWTAIDLWLTNVVLFTLVYWQLDRGGPEGRVGGWHGQVDFYFPRGDSIDHVPADWQPSFMDYLYLAFTTSTAFSPSEIYPLTNRAKAMHIAQSLISLLTVVALAARAISILGT